MSPARAGRAEDAVVTRPELGVYELAMINNGPRLAIRAALTRLLDSGTIQRTSRGFLTTGQATPSDPLEAEIVAATSGRPRPVQLLMLRVSRGPWVRSTIATLSGEGFLVPRTDRRLIMFRNVVPALLLVAAAALADSYGDETSALLLVMIGLFLAVVLARNGQTGVRASAVGAKTLFAYRERETAAAVELEPSLSVALFGMRQLERQAPELAAQVGIPLNDGPLSSDPADA